MDATCDICGRGEPAAVVMIEGARLAACRRCATHGKTIHALANINDSFSLPEAPVHRPKFAETEEIVDGFGAKIKNKREQMGLPLAVIAERINEKESYIDHIEREKLTPTILVARKIEKELGIKIVEKVHAETAQTMQKAASSKEATLAEFLEQPKKK